MCIQNSVGKDGKNHRDDCVIIQILLNYNKELQDETLKVDGAIGPKTCKYIQQLQKKYGKDPIGLVKPNDEILKYLQRAIPNNFGPIMLRGIMPLAKTKKIDLYYKHLVTGMLKKSIKSRLRIAHFLAQLGHESASFLYSEECASGSAYEGREDLGNTQEGDGVRFKGRGLIQLTGRRNYTAYGKAISMALTSSGNWSKVATDPVLATDVACWFWDEHDLNDLADSDKVKEITKIINGGYNGLHDRKNYLRRAKYFLKIN